jgi:hypothetical protein
MQFIPFHTSCKFSPFRSAPFRSLSCEHSWRCNLFHSIQVVTFHRSVPLRSVPFFPVVNVKVEENSVFLFWLFRSVPFFILWTCSQDKEHSRRCNLFHSIQVVSFLRSVPFLILSSKSWLSKTLCFNFWPFSSVQFRSVQFQIMILKRRGHSLNVLSHP